MTYEKKQTNKNREGKDRKLNFKIKKKKTKMDETFV